MLTHGYKGNRRVVANLAEKRDLDLAADVDQTLREMIDSEETRRSWHSRFARSGFLFIITFEIASVISLRVPLTLAFNRLLSFEIFNILTGAFCLYVTWTVWFHYHWRLLVFGFSGLVIASATYLSLHVGRTEPLFMSVIVLLTAGGSLMPWNARWQGALTFLCLSWLGVNAIWSPASDIGLYQWLGLLAAGAIAYSGAQMGARCRTELIKEIDSLRVSQAKLRLELAIRKEKTAAAIVVESDQRSTQPHSEPDVQNDEEQDARIPSGDDPLCISQHLQTALVA
jgi:hypothetical protein